ncbi:putative nucleotidyltransferase [compost metagenome]
MYHYLHMAEGNYREYLQGEQVKIKKYFYVLRPILACDWIERYNTMPPIEFPMLVEQLVQEGSELKEAIQSLLIRKIAGDEMDYEPRISPINEFLDERIRYYKQAVKDMSASASGQDQQLDELFRVVLQEVWG